VTPWKEAGGQAVSAQKVLELDLDKGSEIDQENEETQPPVRRSTNRGHSMERE